MRPESGGTPQGLADAAPDAHKHAAPGGPKYFFCGIELDPLTRAVMHDGQRLPITARLFDTLLVLVERRDRVVNRDDLLAAVWAGRRVEDGTVARTISSLRAILREHGAPETVIITVTHRGYRFGAPVTMTGPQEARAAKAPPARVMLWRGLAIAGAVLILGVVLFPRLHPLPQPAAFAPPAHSIAVLPFDNPGGTAQDADLAYGLAEELITALGRWDQLRVVSLRSAAVFREHSVPLGEIAHRLNAGTVLEGSVRHLGGHMHVTAHLTDALTGFQLWAATYDRDDGDVAGMQADIVRQTVAAMHVSAPSATAANEGTRETSNAQAWDAFFTGVALMSKPSHEDRAQALDAFTRAITLDPDFARAYELRAEASWRVATDPGNLNIPSQDSLLAQAVRDAEKAVSLEPDSGSAHGALGWALLGQGHDVRRAGDEFSVARRLSPGDGAIRAQSAIALLDLGRTKEAVVDARQSVALDPLSHEALQGAAWIFAHAHEAGEYRTVIRHLTALASDYPARNAKDECLNALALAEFDAAVLFCRAAPSIFKPYGLAIAQWKLGHAAEAREALRAFQAMVGDSGAFQYAEIYAVFGDRTASAHWLTVAVQLKDGQLADIVADDFLATMRDTPEFDAAARSVGLR